MNVIGTGWRHYANPALPTQALLRLLDLCGEKQEPLLVIHGDGNGLDQILKNWALRQKAAGHNIDQKPYPADWHIWGRRAGFLRNATMWATNWHHTDLCLAFPGPPGQSPGTANCVDLAGTYGCPVWFTPWGSLELTPMPPLRD